MTAWRSWAAYPLTYRAKEMEILAGWLRAGISGSVVGLAGAGKSNLLGFLCYRRGVLSHYLPDLAGAVVPILVDLNSLPVNDQSTLYRTILYAFYEARERFEPSLSAKIVEVYHQNRAEQDPFLPYTALREMLALFQEQQLRITLVLDHFDNFCHQTDPQTLDTLRGLRDSFKSTLAYIAGLRREVAYLPDPAALGELYEILDSPICWVGAMSGADAQALITQETHLAAHSPAADEVNFLLEISGHYPSLLKSVCRWWLAQPERPPFEAWPQQLLGEQGVQRRLAEIWAGLNEAERLALIDIRRGLTTLPSARKQRHMPALQRLLDKGLCQATADEWQICSPLLVAYVDQQGQNHNNHTIWLDEKTDELYLGQTPLVDLSPLARNLLHFLVQHPHQRHTKTDLIINAWPDDLRRQGVTDDSLYQVVKELRKQIEPDSGQPHYLLTWRGRPEGGYQFFPEGRPA